MKSKSPNTKKASSTTGGTLSDTVDNLSVEIKTLIAMIAQGLDEIVIKHQEVIENQAAFDGKAEKAGELLDGSDQDLQIDSKERLQKKMDRLTKNLPSGFSMRSIDEINKETEESKKDEG